MQDQFLARPMALRWPGRRIGHHHRRIGRCLHIDLGEAAGDHAVEHLAAHGLAGQHVCRVRRAGLPAQGLPPPQPPPPPPHPHPPTPRPLRPTHRAALHLARTREPACANSPRTSSPCTSVTTPANRLDSPRKSATNSVRGRKYSSRGLPDCSILPPFIRQILSDIVIASSWSCVT